MNLHEIVDADTALAHQAQTNLNNLDDAYQYEVRKNPAGHFEYRYQGSRWRTAWSDWIQYDRDTITDWANNKF